MHGGEEGVHAGRRDVQGRRLLQDRQPRQGRRAAGRRRAPASDASSSESTELESTSESTSSTSTASTRGSLVEPARRRRRTSSSTRRRAPPTRGSVAGTDIPRIVAPDREDPMNPVARARHVLARRPWLYWSAVARPRCRRRLVRRRRARPASTTPGRRGGRPAPSSWPPPTSRPVSRSPGASPCGPGPRRCRGRRRRRRPCRPAPTARQHVAAGEVVVDRRRRRHRPARRR